MRFAQSKSAAAQKEKSSNKIRKSGRHVTPNINNIQRSPLYIPPMHNLRGVKIVHLSPRMENMRNVACRSGTVKYAYHYTIIMKLTPRLPPCYYPALP